MSTTSTPADGAELARLFGLESDVGRMMMGIYGKPKVRTQNWRALSTTPLVGGVQPRMKELSTKPDARSAASKTVDRAAIAATDAARPRPLGPRAPPGPAPIDLIPSRRSAAGIAARESLLMGDMASISRPLLRPGRDTDAEKARLQATFFLRGGKGGGIDAAGLLLESEAMPSAYLVRAGQGGGLLNELGVTTAAAAIRAAEIDTNTAAALARASAASAVALPSPPPSPRLRFAPDISTLSLQGSPPRLNEPPMAANPSKKHSFKQTITRHQQQPPIAQ